MFLKFDARAVFNSAEGYRRAAGVLTAAFYSGQQVVPAAISCDALSLELYFKALLTIENGGFHPGKHDLTEYFSALSDKTRARIEEYATAAGSARVVKINSSLPPGEPKLPDFDFKSYLEASKLAFVRFRYPYEILERMKKSPPSGPVMWSGSPFIYAVKRVIIEAHPDWAAN